MLGCIQPMSSPMMKRMLGFCCCCAAAGMLATVTVASMANNPRQMFPATLMVRSFVDCPRRAGSLRPLSNRGRPDLREHALQIGESNFTKRLVRHCHKFRLQEPPTPLMSERHCLYVLNPQFVPPLLYWAHHLPAAEALPCASSTVATPRTLEITSAPNMTLSPVGLGLSVRYRLHRHHRFGQLTAVLVLKTSARACILQ